MNTVAFKDYFERSVMAMYLTRKMHLERVFSSRWTQAPVVLMTLSWPWPVLTDFIFSTVFPTA